MVCLDTETPSLSKSPAGDLTLQGLAPNPVATDSTPMEADQPEASIPQLDPGQLTPDSTVGELPGYHFSITKGIPGSHVALAFEQQPYLPGVIVLEDDRVLAMISRQIFLERLSQPYGLEIFLKRPIQSFLSITAIGDPFILPATEPIDRAVQRSLQRPNKHLYEPILVEQSNRRWLLIDFQVLLLAQTQILSLQKEELQQANERIQTTQKQMIAQEKLASLGGLTAGIAHEIRNPLNFINNYAELAIDLTEKLLNKFEPHAQDIDPKVAETIRKITTKLNNNAGKIDHYGKRAEKIVSNMLMHYRGGERRWEWANLNELLDESVSLAYHGMRAKDPTFNVSFEKNYDDFTGEVEVVPQDLNRVFINIISNACYALKQKWQEQHDDFVPTIQVSTKSLGDAIVIAIRDNGPGMTQEILSKIFDHFFTTKPSGEGTGLGLSLSYEIVTQQHQGQLEVVSEPGNYTEFLITLPRKNASNISTQ